MADLDLSTIPFVPPVEVALIDVKTGRPLTAMHDFMFAQSSWMSQNVVDLKTKVTTLIDDQGDLSARLNVEETARINGDTALSGQITTVDAKANNATANGQVYLQAMAGPAGSVAAYGIFLTAGNVFTGLMLVAYSGGVSKIVMTAGSLEFYDSSSGSQINMLTYSGGEWLLNGNVTLQASNGAGTMRWADGNLILRDAGGNEIVGMGLALP